MDDNGTKFLLYARRCSVDFSRTAMVGRQGLHVVPEVLSKNLNDFGINVAAKECGQMLSSGGGFAEPFLRLLGAAEISSFDASDFESATNVHDFNLPLVGFDGKFTVVVDGGTLEHVFNFPQAITNCMKMLQVGGHFLGISPANNWFGHGFYQFSPELFFRVFSPGNGFDVKRMFVCEMIGASWYEVPDPATVGHRVELTNRRRLHLMVIAQKIAETNGIAHPIEQSDYSAQWEARAARGFVDVRRWRRFIPAQLEWPLRYLRGTILSPRLPLKKVTPLPMRENEAAPRASQ
ncbi:MAG: hypothetical protein ACRD4X_18245 [Candidatus Acidiferrales bacterium]